MEEHHYSNGHLKVLSELFFAEAKLQEAEVKEKNARKYYEKSLTLLEFVERESTTFSLEIQSRIQELKYKIPRD